MLLVFFLSRTEGSDVLTRPKEDICGDSPRKVPFRLRRRSLSPTMRLESLMKDGNDKDEKK